MNTKRSVDDQHRHEHGAGHTESLHVEIYVTAHCRICEYAHEVAGVIRRDFPEVKLEIVDIATSTRPIPEVVFATPTYLLNGRIWSLGNPSPEEVQQRLAEGIAKPLAQIQENRNE